MNNRRRLLIFQESPNPSNPTEPIYHAVNKLGLPICGAGPDMPSILDLPLRILRAFTEIFNDPRYKGWAIVSAAPYKDPTVSGTFFAVVLEQVQGQVQGQGQGCSMPGGIPTGSIPGGSGSGSVHGQEGSMI